MVVFTCNYCGESLQKPKVEKHYNFVCRKVKNLTCVDCFKDFKGDEYEIHIKCCTEEERYAPKGAHPMGIIKKGEVKQESWITFIKSIIDKETHLQPSHRNLLNTISLYSNIPRKKPKFINFLKNSSGNRINMKDVEAVWNIIEKHKDQENSTKQGAENGDAKEKGTNGIKSSKKEKSDNGEESDMKTDALDEISGEVIVASDKKKKSKKRKREENDSTNNTIITEKSDVATDPVDGKSEEENVSVKKKKTKKRKHEENEADIHNSTDKSDIETNQMSQKSEEGNVVSGKKKKSKKIKHDDSGLDVSNNTNNTKKRKHEENGADVDNGIDNISVAEKSDAETYLMNEKSGEENIVSDKKKKSKNIKHGDNGVDVSNNMNNINANNKFPTEIANNHLSAKVKSKNKIIEEPINGIDKNEATEILEVSENISKKSKKRKSAKIGDINNHAAVTQLENETSVTLSKSKKKKGNADETDTIINANLGTEDATNSSLNLTSSSEVLDQSQGTPNIKDKILTIMSKKGTISLKKLEKKVLALYRKHTDNEEEIVKLSKKFHKKLKKIPDLQISDEQVILHKVD